MLILKKIWLGSLLQMFKTLLIKLFLLSLCQSKNYLVFLPLFQNVPQKLGDIQKSTSIEIFIEQLVESVVNDSEFIVL